MTHFDEKDLTRELRERSSDVGGHPIGFDAVRSSARRIRRRRTIVAGAVAVAVTGVALPTGLAVTSALDPDGRQNPDRIATSPTPDTTPAPAPTPRVDGTFPLLLDDTPRGPRPTVSYVLDDERTLVTPEGALDLPQAYSQVLPYRDGWLALGASDEGGFENVVLDSGMTVKSASQGGEGMVRNTEGTRVLYVRRDGDRRTVVDEPAGPGPVEGTFTWSAPRGSTVVPVGYLGEGSVVYEAMGDETQAFLATAYGDVTPLDGFLKVMSVSESAGLVAGRISYDSQGRSCYGLMDPEASTTEMVWETCDHSLFELSPDGQHVIAGPPDYDMWGPSGLSVLDVGTGRVVVEFAPEREVIAQVSQATWEDEDTVLAVLVRNDDMGIVRAELDGHLESTTETYPTADMTLRLWFAERPRS